MTISKEPKPLIINPSDLKVEDPTDALELPHQSSQVSESSEPMEIDYPSSEESHEENDEEEEEEEQHQSDSEGSEFSEEGRPMGEDFYKTCDTLAAIVAKEGTINLNMMVLLYKNKITWEVNLK